MKKIGIYILLFILSGSCANQQKEKGSDKQVVTVSILPQKYFVEKITGTHFTINVMIPPGASPVTYEPTPKQMKELSVSNVYFRIGHIEFEKSWMKKLQSVNPGMEVIDLSKKADLIEPEQEAEAENGDGHEGHHHHGVDPHIWVSPKEVKKQVEIIYQFFAGKYPELKPEFESNYKSFVSEIDSLDKYLDEQLKPFAGKKLLIFHPALTYLARDYGLQQISIEIDGKEPTPANIQQIIHIAKKEDVKIIFVQKQFSTHNAEVIANEIKGRVVQIDPLSPDWVKNIEQIANEIVKSYTSSF